MKKLLFMLLCCTVFVIGCGNNAQEKEAEETVAGEFASGDNQAVTPQDNAGNEEKEMAAQDWGTKGKVELEETKDYAKAIEYFTKSIETFEKAWVYGDRGRAEVLAGNQNAALADFTKAIEMEKRSAYYQWRADLYDAMGNKQAADADLAEAQKLPQE